MGCDVDSLLGPFGPQFALHFVAQREPYVATRIMRNACLYISRPPILASKMHPKYMVVQDAFLDTLFVIYVDLYTKAVDLGTSKSRKPQFWVPKSGSQQLFMVLFFIAFGSARLFIFRDCGCPKILFRLPF